MWLLVLLLALVLLTAPLWLSPMLGSNTDAGIRNALAASAPDRWATSLGGSLDPIATPDPARMSALSQWASEMGPINLRAQTTCALLPHKGTNHTAWMLPVSAQDTEVLRLFVLDVRLEGAPSAFDLDVWLSLPGADSAHDVSHAFGMDAGLLRSSRSVEETLALLPLELVHALERAYDAGFGVHLSENLVTMVLEWPLGAPQHLVVESLEDVWLRAEAIRLARPIYVDEQAHLLERALSVDVGQAVRAASLGMLLEREMSARTIKLARERLDELPREMLLTLAKSRAPGVRVLTPERRLALLREAHDEGDAMAIHALAEFFPWTTLLDASLPARWRQRAAQHALDGEDTPEGRQERDEALEGLLFTRPLFTEARQLFEALTNQGWSPMPETLERLAKHGNKGMRESLMNYITVHADQRDSILALQFLSKQGHQGAASLLSKLQRELSSGQISLTEDDMTRGAISASSATRGELTELARKDEFEIVD